MAQNTQDTSATKVIIPCRFSYAHVWKPSAMADGSGTPKFSVSCIFSKDDKDTLAKVDAAVKAATEQGKTGKWNGKIPANLKLPLRDGDKERGDQEAYKNSYFITASSGTKPGIVDNKRQPIEDETEFYSGCFGRASVNFYPFAAAGSKGVACGLNNVQKLKDGEALGGKPTPEEDFDDVEVDDDIVGG